MILRISYIVLIFVVANGEKVNYENYAVYKIYPENAGDIAILQELQQSETQYDFWTDPTPSAKFVNIMTSPSNKEELEDFLAQNNLRSEITIENVQQLINKETVGIYSRSNFRSMNWTAYYTLDDINTWLDDLAVAYPTLVTPLVGGSTIENREIRGIKISHGTGKRAIFLEGGIHSREWISPATVNYIAYQLLTSEDQEVWNAARNFDWYIFPVTNPDGYVWTHVSNRMWRKNRRIINATADVYGIDLNRNWNNNWMVAGASDNPSSDSYAGTGPFSEPETSTLSEFISTIADKLDIYLSFHSYSQLLLLPFGNSTDPYSNYYEAMNIGRRAMGALSVRYGTQYVTGNIAEAIYLATGGSVDWVKEYHQVPLVYCYELRDTGTYGFLLPTEQILPNNEEVLDSVMDILHQADRFLGISSSAGLRATLFMVILSVFWSLL